MVAEVGAAVSLAGLASLPDIPVSAFSPYAASGAFRARQQSIGRRWSRYLRRDVVSPCKNTCYFHFRQKTDAYQFLTIVDWLT